MPSDSDEKDKHYRYDPSLATACVFTVLFGTTAWHSILIAKHRTWYFIPMLTGGIFEIVGYAARGVSSGQAPHLTIAPYVIRTLLLLVAPALLAASIYMILGRIIVSVGGESYGLIKKRWLAKAFVTSDALSFFIQLGGGGLMPSSKASSTKLGSHIVLAGLPIQTIIFGFFIVVTLTFPLRLRAMPTTQSHDPSLPWKKLPYMLYTPSAFIMVRSTVRVAEFVEGFEGVIILHEVLLYIFDTASMAVVMVIFNFGFLQPSRSR
ncbi:RTA1 like protein [Acephala macrosclerotiorum]|nr:RTA1 like protein [Acephala macrosclerotiorum]